MDQGYTFDFIEGEMWEKSPFTFDDFIKQRKRWMQGIFLVATDPKLSFKSRFFIGLSILAWITGKLLLKFKFRPHLNFPPKFKL